MEILRIISSVPGIVYWELSNSFDKSKLTEDELFEDELFEDKLFEDVVSLFIFNS